VSDLEGKRQVLSILGLTLLTKGHGEAGDRRLQRGCVGGRGAKWGVKESLHLEKKALNGYVDASRGWVGTGTEKSAETLDFKKVGDSDESQRELR